MIIWMPDDQIVYIHKGKNRQYTIGLGKMDTSLGSEKQP